MNSASCYSLAGRYDLIVMLKNWDNGLNFETNSLVEKNSLNMKINYSLIAYLRFFLRVKI